MITVFKERFGLLCRFIMHLRLILIPIHRLGVINLTLLSPILLPPHHPPLPRVTNVI
jgi:hypothetical protein